MRPPAPIAPSPAGGRPTVLLLQGPRSPFMARLADALEAGGARALRVLFGPGDALYWGRRPAIRRRGPVADWPAEAARLIAAEGVSDVLGLGDGRPVHRAAFAAARAAGARIHVLEQGLLRPGWITLEPDRLGGWRPTPGALAADPAPLPPPGPPGAGFAAVAAMDVAHHLADMTLGRLPGRAPPPRHELHPPLAEWAGWAWKAARAPLRAAARRRTLAALAAAPGPVFLMALQLETDFMIRDHGPPGGLRAALAATLASFARAAPPTATLVVKPHPLDPGLTPWARLVAGGGAAERTRWLDGGDADALLPRLAGVVTVNSTLGLAALCAGVPVKALGRAVYEDLCAPGPLDAFWAAPPRPDPAAVAAFRAALIRAIQLPGAFDGPGMAVGAQAVAARLLGRAGA